MRTSLKYILMALLSPSAFALGQFTPITTFSAGPAWESNGTSSTVDITPSLVQKYTADNETNTLIQGELFLATQFFIVPNWRMHLGLLVGAINAAEMSGDVLQNGVNNGTYQYEVTHLRTAVKDKVLYDFGSPFIPWASFSLGASFNHAYHFESDITPIFRTNTMTAFSYSLGVGFQYAFSEHWQVGLGYEFTDWGKHELDELSTAGSHGVISLDNFYTNALLFNIAWAD